MLPTMKRFWIIGAGRFGTRAARKLRRTHAAAEIRVVDKNPAVCDELARHDFQSICTDGIAYLDAHLGTAEDPHWIIPAAPVHVAFEFIRRRLSAEGRLQKVPVPAELSRHLPHLFAGGDHTLYASNADFICPEDCPEPADVCTVTGKPRPCTLYRELEQAAVDDAISIVIRSRQLLPGVGGYRPEDLLAAVERVRASQKTILLSTACRCHGVIDAFRFSR
jgi:hypothetical protein